ncbi:uncharacterized protein LOC143178258 [Calliopsis andreniformis]|uniref:uncharacterized protein LOC143178258 n=1 Tax=Calliopsis andreniformis TaxID=337506 RepID=UPI003FCE5FB0
MQQQEWVRKTTPSPNCRVGSQLCRNNSASLNRYIGKSNLPHHRISWTRKYFKDQFFLRCEDDYIVAADYIAECIATLQVDQPPPSTSTCSHRSATEINARPTSQLARVNLPTFSGDIATWKSFHDRFKLLIIDDPSLSDVTRLHHLNSCLKDDASDIISTLPITENNFKVAWNLINSHFDNDRHLIQIHLRALSSLTFIVEETAQELRSLLKKVNVAVQSLRNLKRPVDSWDDILVFLVSERLDASTQKAWELQLGTKTKYPPYVELDEFLANRILALDSIPSDRPTSSKSRSAGARLLANHSTTTVLPTSPLCHEPHGLHNCSKFKDKLPAHRFEYVKSQNRCINCHKSSNLNPVSADKPPEASDYRSPRNRTVRVSTSAGRSRIVRALLDQGSVVTLISKNLAQQLNAPKQRVSLEVNGIGSAKADSKFITTIKVSPSSGHGPAYSTTALILNSLSRYSPPRMLSHDGWDHIRNLPLVDPDPMSPDPIDLIIGVDDQIILYGVVLLEGFRSASRFEPLAQNSIFGWIISGPIEAPPSLPSGSVSGHHVTTVDSLEQELRRFLEIENIMNPSLQSVEDERCFVETHSRDDQGRYVVRLRFKEGPLLDIGETRCAVQSMLRRFELRLASDFELKQQYTAFIREYESLGHIRRVPDDAKAPKQAVYLPQHAVVRSASPSTKLRVGFNATQRSSNQ